MGKNKPQQYLNEFGSPPGADKVRRSFHGSLVKPLTILKCGMAVILMMSILACANTVKTEGASSLDGKISPDETQLSGFVPQAAPTLTPEAYLPMITKAPTLTTKYFTTLPPGSTLPSDSECAAAIKPRPENKGANLTFNTTAGNQQLPSDFLSGDDPRGNSQLIPRVDGKFTGSTDEILQWVACKWGIDEDMVRAQAAIESWWHQDTKGDWGTDASRCPPGHGLGVDGRSGQCPESWGILQNRYPYEQASWPGIGNSTAFNADTAYAIWRVCFEGYEGWLNTVDRESQYGAGDAWGCIGRWYAGRWYTQDAKNYIARVQDYLNTRVWETPDFQEP